MTPHRNAFIAAALTTSLAVTVGAAAVASSQEFDPKPIPTPTVTETVYEERPVRILKVPEPAPTVTVRETVHVSRQHSRKPVNPPAVSGSPKDYARSLVGSEQFSCLNSLWQKESGWNYRATNPSSGAYGIPQSLPGSKMASAGSDWRTNPRTQIRWGVSYIKSRYGTPCGAWNHSKSHGWY